MGSDAYRTDTKQGSKDQFSEQTFKTIEFGFAPFVPFSQQFKMDLIGGKNQADFKVHANSEMQGWDPDWRKKYDAYQQQGKSGNQTKDDLNNLPTGQIQFESASMTEELADLLQGDSPIYSKYDNQEHTELEDRIAIDWLFDGNNQWNMEGKSWRTPGVDARRDVMDKQIDSQGKEMLDLQATTDKEAGYLEYVMHRIAANAPSHIDGAEFVEGAQGIEMTHMINEKYTAKLFNETDKLLSIEERWDEAGQQLAANVMEAYDTLEEKYKDIYELANVGGADAFSEAYYGKASGEKAGKIGGYDSVGYMAKQMLDRFAEGLVRTSGDMGGYLWQEPLVPLGSPAGTLHTVVGFASFRPKISRDKGSFQLEGISVDTFTVDIAAQVTDMGFATAEEYLAYLHKAGKYGYGTLGQFLLWDQLVNFTKDANSLTAGTLALGEGLGLWTNFAGQRGEMLGSSIRYQVDGIARGAVGGVGSVEAVQVLSSGDIAKALKAKFKDFFEGKEMKGAFASFYEKAVQAANIVTDAWKSKISVPNMGLTPLNNVWADYLMDNDGRRGDGIGLPFFFYSGEDPEGYKRFKIRAPLSQFLLKNVRRVDAALSGDTAWKPTIGGRFGQPKNLGMSKVGRSSILKKPTMGTQRASNYYEVGTKKHGLKSGPGGTARWNMGSLDWKDKALYGN
tara:strand:- start:3764 stop:5794 length:2031 start_codon:yes stop_codon:yes gene_type:complete